ncbi:hypothetical protein PsorP6_007687 [Peronosclerospora sorghi]|uniref:Uncharacterized protein n=1 Tax=Peronosclerospora sorghi TaxID=230839 RepID=A0ACC0W7A2_9STRA|nr:hypothetical protein PsorP6_007687 [Peronosclerospora sorghi]
MVKSEIYITRVDLQNFQAKERVIKLKTDAPLMVDHFCRKVAENPDYVFEFETDKDARLTNAFGYLLMPFCFTRASEMW